MVSYGLATVLQAVGARRTSGGDTLDVGLLVRLAHQGPYLAGLALDVGGVLFTVLALRKLPLFVVQAAIAGSLAVTAVAAARTFHTPLKPGEWAAIGAVGVGLVLVAASVGPEGPPPTSLTARLVLVAMVAGVGLLAVPAGRVTGTRAAALLGALAGLAFGLGNIALRVIPSLRPMALVTNPATIVAVSGALLGALTLATGLQRGSVTVTMGASVVTETLLPAIYGAVLLGERPRPGWLPVGVTGFAVTIVGALVLARFGDVSA